MRKDTKWFAKAAEAFKQRVSTWILANGGILREKRDGWEHEIQTPAGRLKITVYEDWIAQRFDDPEKGRKLSSLMSVSKVGKCNFHYGHIIEKCEDLECDTLEIDWQLWLRRILTKELETASKLDQLSHRERLVLDVALSYMYSNLDDVIEAVENRVYPPITEEEVELLRNGVKASL